MVDHSISLEELLASYLPSQHRPSINWTWDDEEQDIAIRVCLCCGLRGHYQEQLESYIRQYGLENMGVYLVDYLYKPGGTAWDGHHRIIAAKHLDIPTIPLESKEDADARWVRNHGTRSWEERIVGDKVEYGRL